MNTKELNRNLSILMVLLPLFLCLSPAALAEGEESPSASGESVGVEAEMAEASTTEAGKNLQQMIVVDLGKVPEETKMEERCEALLVTDIASGVPIREKNAQVPLPINGAVVQLMTVVTALDYLDPTEELTVTKQQLKDVSNSTIKLGLRENNKVYVADLFVSMLYTGAADSAQVIADATVKSAGARSIGDLMQAKAEQIGMMTTNYSESDGICADSTVITTAMDQCVLYLYALNHPDLAALLKNGTYDMLSQKGMSGTNAENAREKDASSINDNLPPEIENRVKAVVPGQRIYDVRLSSAVSGSVKATKRNGSDEQARNTDAFGVVLFRSTTDRTDLAILYWLPDGGNNVKANHLVYLTDTFSRSRVVDLIPYVEVATTNLSVEKSGVSISGWSLENEHALYGRILSLYDPEANTKVNQETMKNEYELVNMKVILKPDIGTLVTNEDGSRTMKAKVLVDNSVEDTVSLATAPKTTQTAVSQSTNVLYTEDDVIPEEPTLMSQYGWMIIIGGVVILALLVIIIGVIIRSRMERW